MSGFLEAFLYADDTYINVYTAIARWLIPGVSILVLLRCIIPLFTFRREPEIWAWLLLSNNKRIPITHWETVIGQSKRSDFVIAAP